MLLARSLVVLVSWGLGGTALAQGLEGAAGGAGAKPRLVDAPGSPPQPAQPGQPAQPPQPGAPGPKKLPEAPVEDPAVVRAQIEKAVGDLTSKDKDVLYQALTVISRRKVVTSVPQVMKVLATGEEPFTRQAAAAALGDMRACDAVPALADALRDRTPAVAQTAYKSLRLVTGHDLGLDPLARPAERTRARGAMIEWWGRHEAEVRPKCALEHALWALEGVDDAALTAAVAFVVERKVADAAPRLARVLARHADATTRMSAATALGALRVGDSVLPLADALRDAEEGVAQAARAALLELTAYEVPLPSPSTVEDREKARTDLLTWWGTHEAEVRARLKAAK